MNNIILIGMPGAGKSTVGVVLAKTLGMQFVDTDLLIQRQVGAKLHEIIAEKGIAEFLRLEQSVLLSMHCADTVVATGGSAVLGEAAMRHLKAMGTVVYLAAGYADIKKRISSITTRGVVVEKGQTLRDIYRQRIPLYEAYADLTVYNGKNLEQTVEAVLSRLPPRLPEDKGKRD